jgi:hypothetical protein
MIKFTLLISLYFLSPQHTSSTPECSFNVNPNWPSLSCFQFNSWPELIHLLDKPNFDTSEINALEIFPHESLILTSQVLGELSRKLDKGPIFINFHRLKGISVLDNFSNQTYFQSDAPFPSGFVISISQSKIDFFIGDKSQSELECSWQMIPQTAITFSYIRSLFFCHRIKYSKKPVCPFVFYNAHLNDLHIWNQLDSFLIAPRFTIVCLLNTSKQKNNSLFAQFFISNFNFCCVNS